MIPKINRKIVKISRSYNPHKTIFPLQTLSLLERESVEASVNLRFLLFSIKPISKVTFSFDISRSNGKITERFKNSATRQFFLDIISFRKSLNICLNVSINFKHLKR